MAIRQISVFVQNTSGRLAEVTALLAANNLNLRAISIADTADFGILRMIVDQPDQTLAILKTAGITAKETEVIGVEVEDNPGELARVTELFKDSGINIEYLYASLERCSDRAIIVLKVNQVATGIKLLDSNGFHTVSAF